MRRDMDMKKVMDGVTVGMDTKSIPTRVEERNTKAF